MRQQQVVRYTRFNGDSAYVTRVDLKEYVGTQMSSVRLVSCVASLGILGEGDVPAISACTDSHKSTVNGQPTLL
jgi:hypothetical protein